MQLTKQLKSFIEQERDRRNWSNADLARASGFTETTWSRILNTTRPQKTIKDDIVAKLGELFGRSPLEMLLVSQGRTPQSAAQQVTELSPAYLDRHDRLANWLRSVATPDATDAVHATAKALGYKDCKTSAEESCPRQTGNCPGLKKGNQITGAA